MAATAKAVFDGDSSKLDAVIKGIDRKLLALKADFATVAAGLATIFAVPAAAGAALVAGVGNVLEIGGALNDLHNNTGIAVDELVVLQEEFKEAGKAGEDVGGVINKMQDTLAKGTADSVISQLGINLDDLKRQTPLAQFHTLGEEINKIGDASERVAVARAIFGKSGGSLLSVFASHGFGAAAIAVGEQAAILKRDAALFDDAGDKLGTAGLKVQGFFVGVADRVVPTLGPLLDKMIALDLTSKGQDVGDFLAVMLAAFDEGDVIEFLSGTINYSLAESANFFATALLHVIAFVGEAFTQLMQKIFRAMTDGVIALVSKFDAIPGVKGYVAQLQQKQNKDEDDFDSELAAIRGITKYGKIFDTDAIYKKVSDVIGPAASLAEYRRNEALKQFGLTPGGPVPEDMGLGSGSIAASALQRIGGAFGVAAGGDPLLAATRESNSILREIRDRLPPVADDTSARRLTARYA
jgi:hypothetical protein